MKDIIETNIIAFVIEKIEQYYCEELCIFGAINPILNYLECTVGPNN